jgi:hypothetical protein
MIISASRRTDLPAFYSEWLMNRVRAGYCTVPNPFNPKQVSRVSLDPKDVEVIAFWTRNARPLMRHLPEFDERGYRYYFMVTLMDNPRPIDPKCPPLEASLDTFRELAGRIGPDRVMWRYDPIYFSRATDAEYHARTYERIAGELQGYTHRSIISILTVYRKSLKRLGRLAEEGFGLAEYRESDLSRLMPRIAASAAANGMEVFSCAEKTDLSPYAIRPGKCIDDAYISKTFGIELKVGKDPAQRKECGCVAGKDIGMYDSCLFECRYCYATSSPERARARFRQHNRRSPSLIDWYEAEHSLP